MMCLFVILELAEKRMRKFVKSSTKEQQLLSVLSGDTCLVCE